MIKKMVWAIPVSIGAVALAATAIGVGYTQSQKANPYADFYRRPSQPGDTSLIDAYTSAVQLGAKVIVGPGFTQANPIKASASQQYFKNHNTGFLLLDETFGAAPGGYQVASVTYRVSEAGFLAGIALGEYLNYYQSIFAPGADDRLTYSAWGGVPAPTILTFMAGFQQGINYFNNVLIPTINKGKTTTTYKPIYQVADKESFAGGFAPDQGKPIAERLFGGIETQTWPVYQQGPVENNTNPPEWTNKTAFEKPIATNEIPDAVLIVAGPQVTAGIDELNLKNANSVIVGVDVAQEEDQSLNRPLQKPLKNKDGSQTIDKPICFSIMKDLANSTDKVLTNITNGVKGKNDENGYSGLGWNSAADLDNEGVALSKAGQTFLYNALVKGGIIKNGANVIDDPTKIPEGIDGMYATAKEAIQQQPDYLYNQGNRDKNLQPQYSQYIPQSDFSGDDKNYYGYQNRNQFIIPYKSNDKPVDWKSCTYRFDDNIKNVSLVTTEEQDKYNSFIDLVSKELQTDRENAVHGKDPNTFKNDVKLILSDANAVLLDSSFSQGSFQGMLLYYYQQDPDQFTGLWNQFRTNVMHVPPVNEPGQRMTKINDQK